MSGSGGSVEKPPGGAVSGGLGRGGQEGADAFGRLPRMRELIVK
jgi:hypothetical protein